MNLKMSKAITSSESCSGSLVSVRNANRRLRSMLQISSSSRCSSPVARHNRPSTYENNGIVKKKVLITCYEDGKTISESAKLAQINENTAKYIISQYKKNGGVLIEKQRGGKRNIKARTVILNKIEQLNEENPSISSESLLSVRNADRRLRSMSQISSSSRCSSPVARHNRPSTYENNGIVKKKVLITCYEDGKTISESAKLAQINENTAKYIISQYKKNGGVLIEKQRGGKRNIKARTVILNKIEQLNEENPSISSESLLSVRNADRRLRSMSQISSSSRCSSPVGRHNRPSTYENNGIVKKKVLIRCYEDGKTITESAKLAHINENTAKYILSQYKKNGGVLIEKQRGGKRNIKISPLILNKIEQLIEGNPSVTLKNIRAKILESEHVSLSISSINNALRQLGIKRASLRVDRSN